MPAPDNNPITAAKVELGRRLFFDTRLSRDFTVACATCHHPERAFTDGRVNGDLGNQGIHQMDIARWFLGHDHLSPRVFSVGGRLGYVDDGETPNTQIVYHDFGKGNAPLIFEVRGLTESPTSKNRPTYMGGSVAVLVVS